MLSTAELIHERTQGKRRVCPLASGDVFEPLQAESPTVIQSLAALDTPLMTTNYDDLIEKVTGLRHVTWNDASNAARVVRGEDRRVLHLHGHWEEPESVVLGIRSYESGAEQSLHPSGDASLRNDQELPLRRLRRRRLGRPELRELSHLAGGDRDGGGRGASALPAGAEARRLRAAGPPLSAGLRG